MSSNLFIKILKSSIYALILMLFFLFSSQVYHTLFWPLEWTVAGRDNNTCYAKVICNKQDNVSSRMDMLRVFLKRKELQNYFI